MQKALKKWYIPLVLGVLLLGLSLWMLFNPDLGFATLTTLFEWSFIFIGLAEVLFALELKNSVNNWGWYLFSGILFFLMGVFLIRHPLVSAASFSLYVGLICMFMSISALSKGSDLMALNAPGSGWMIFWGVLGLFLSFMLIWNPAAAGLTAVYWASFSMLSLAIFGISFGLKWRKAVEWMK